MGIISKNDMKLVCANPTGEEQGFIYEEMDLEVGDSNDFEIRLSADSWDKSMLNYDSRIYIEGTEYGGILKNMKVITSTNEIVWSGDTWRGLLKRKVVIPPTDSSHLILNGELNTLLRELIGNRFDSLFVVPNIDSGATVENWKVDRYVTLYDAMIKLLDSKGYRLQIKYVRAEREKGKVEVTALKKADFSTIIRYDQDSSVNFEICDSRNGANHLVCIGEGQNEQRIKIDLYVQRDGNIGKVQFYKGLDELEAVYNYSNADAVELEKEGIKKLKELQNYKSANMQIQGLEVEIGDTVTGYEKITETEVTKPIVGKILKMQNGNYNIEYKLKGDD